MQLERQATRYTAGGARCCAAKLAECCACSAAGAAGRASQTRHPLAHLGGALHDALNLAGLVVLRARELQGEQGRQSAQYSPGAQYTRLPLLGSTITHCLLTLTNATVYLSVGLKGMNLARLYSSHRVSLRQWKHTDYLGLRYSNSAR